MVPDEPILPYTVLSDGRPIHWNTNCMSLRKTTKNETKRQVFRWFTVIICHELILERKWWKGAEAEQPSFSINLPHYTERILFLGRKPGGKWINAGETKCTYLAVLDLWSFALWHSAWLIFDSLIRNRYEIKTKKWKRKRNETNATSSCEVHFTTRSVGYALVYYSALSKQFCGLCSINHGWRNHKYWSGSVWHWKWRLKY